MTPDDSKKLTEKQQFWLTHLKACEMSGQTTISYAAEHDLKAKHLYNWKTRMIKEGYLPVSAAALQETCRVSNPPRKIMNNRGAKLNFTAVRVAGERAMNPSIRICFTNGILLELGRSAQATPNPQLLSLLAALP